MLGNFFTDAEVSTILPQTSYKLWHFKIVKVGQNLHANMEGFRRASHIYPERDTCFVCSIRVFWEILTTIIKDSLSLFDGIHSVSIKLVSYILL